MTRITNIRPASRALAVLVAATALTMFSQSAVAQGTALAGAWTIDPAKSNFSAGSASLSIARSGAGMDKSASSVLVISDEGNVYLATGSAMREAAAFGYGRMETGKMMLIGTHARRDDVCSFRCQSGLMERNLTLRFNSVDGTERLMGEMLAFKSSKP